MAARFGTRHPFTPKLMALSRCVPLGPNPLPAHLSLIKTPLRWRAWENALCLFPDQDFAEWVVQGIHYGFQIGFDYNQRPQLRSKARNMGSAYEHPEVVAQYLAEECRLGRVAGPISVLSSLQLQVSSFGVKPKLGQPNKWRLILDLGRSVNDGIDRATCSLSYVTVDDIAAVVIQFGRGTWIAKSDIAHAYRQGPVHPHDRPLLGMVWRGRYFVDCTLPFGLRSDPLIFSAVAEALEWVARLKGAQCLFHYIDDFNFVGPPSTDGCVGDLRAFLRSCDELGVVVASHKTEGPATCLTVLGIEIDSGLMEMRLPADKLHRLSALLAQWRGKRSGRREELESLVGLLQHASKVVPAGRLFIHRIYNLLAQTHNFKRHYSVRLNAECRADIEWWCAFLQAWNGTSMLRPLRLPDTDANFWSDASGGWGCGAHWQGRWFQVACQSLPIAAANIAAKELFPIVAAALVWGHEWRGLTVWANCDNSAVVEVINNHSAKDNLLCHLMHALPVFHLRLL